jgi:flagellar hook assembly protein FlgD
MEGKKGRLNKEKIKEITKFLAILSIILFPFLSITNLVGMDTFIDSFENPDSYVYIKNMNGFFVSNVEKASYVIIQKTGHPDFNIRESDTVIYSSITGEIVCNKIEHINNIGPINRYKIKASYFEENSETIFEDQIIGKVVKVVNDDMWNTLLIKAWGATIYNLNINTLL